MARLSALIRISSLGEPPQVHAVVESNGRSTDCSDSIDKQNQGNLNLLYSGPQAT